MGGKKYILCAAVILIAVVLTSSVLPLDKTVHILADDEIAVGTDILEYKLLNLSLRTVYYGEPCRVEKLNDTQWENVKVTMDNYAWNLWLGYAYPLTKSRQDMVCYLPAYGITEPGRYRLVKTIETGRKRKEHVICKEFTVV